MIENGLFDANNLASQGILPEILLPLGISFFTFQSMSYTIDVYRREIPTERSWLNYAFYVSFFPQLVAGPIVKAKEFLPQIHDFSQGNHLLGGHLFSAFSWILLGIFKKAILADRLSTFVDPVFSQPEIFSQKATLIAVISYGFQIFLDFSGYTDIAIGLALILGFKLPINFKLPYLSQSFSDFWRRWHISLSSWLRDYLYIGLGGNKISAFITYRNLFLVMLLGGIWHGAAWNFLLWGGLHGIFLALERFFKLTSLQNRLFSILYGTFVIGIVFLLWIFFRSSDVSTALTILERLFTSLPGIDLGYTKERNFIAILFLVIIGHVLGIRGFHPRYWENVDYRPILHGIGFSLVLIILVLFSIPGKPFIYFVF